MFRFFSVLPDDVSIDMQLGHGRGGETRLEGWASGQ